MIFDSSNTDVFLGARNQFVMIWTGATLDLWKPVYRPGESATRTELRESMTESGRAECQ